MSTISVGRTPSGKTMQGLAWQPCRVHVLRNFLAHVPRGQEESAAAFVRTKFAQPDADAAQRQLREVATRHKRFLSRSPACSLTLSST